MLPHFVGCPRYLLARRNLPQLGLCTLSILPRVKMKSKDNLGCLMLSWVSARNMKTVYLFRRIKRGRSSHAKPSLRSPSGFIPPGGAGTQDLGRRAPDPTSESLRSPKDASRSGKFHYRHESPCDWSARRGGRSEGDRSSAGLMAASSSLLPSRTSCLSRKK